MKVYFKILFDHRRRHSRERALKNSFSKNSRTCSSLAFGIQISYTRVVHDKPVTDRSHPKTNSESQKHQRQGVSRCPFVPIAEVQKSEHRTSGGKFSSLSSVPLFAGLTRLIIQNHRGAERLCVTLCKSGIRTCFAPPQFCPPATCR